MMFSGFIFVILNSFLFVHAVRYAGAKCPNVTTQQDFDMKRYAGIWYEVQRIDNAVQSDATCVLSSQKLLPDNTMMVNTTMNIRGKNIRVSCNLHEGSTHDGKLVAVFPKGTPQDVDYWVIGTDYTNYAIVFSCTPGINDTHEEFAWVLSRASQMKATVQSIVNETLAKNNIDGKNFRATQQDVCYTEKRTMQSSNSSMQSSSVLLVAIIFVLNLSILTRNIQ